MKRTETQYQVVRVADNLERLVSPTTDKQHAHDICRTYSRLSTHVVMSREVTFTEWRKDLPEEFLDNL